jgi:hypothetical protein
MNTTFSAFSARLRRSIDAWPADPNFFNELAVELFALQYPHNTPYRQLCVARGASPSTVRRWQDIPAVPTAAFKEWELTSLPRDGRTAVFHSSGTTGQQPSRHFHNDDSLTTYECSLRNWFAARVPAATQSSMIILTPPAAQAPHSSLVHMFDILRRDRGLPVSAFAGQPGPDGSWMLDWNCLLERLREAEQLPQPVGILGTAFSFVQFIDRARAERLAFQLPRGSWALETGGYKGRSREVAKADLHDLIGRTLEIPGNRIISEYGMSELSAQAYDTLLTDAPATQECERAFQFPPWARVQIISPETGAEAVPGEAGLLRIFDLSNVRSVMAIQTEDLAMPHGAGFRLLGRAATSEARGCSLMPA